MDATQLDVITKLGLSVILGMTIGLEREFNKSAAGIKTYSIVCLGAALFSMGSFVTDIKAAAGIITGIGFLGAAMIFRTENRVVGLTTAALIWVTASIGFVVGIGMYWAATVSTALLLFILVPVEWVERRVFRPHEPANK